MSRERGLTMVELLVAMAISAVIALAAVSALIISRQGFTSVDAASQLRDNGRFAADLIQRLGVQTGYKDVLYATTNRATNVVGVNANPAPNVTGFNNATIDATDPLNTATTRTAGTLGYGSDILILRYQTGETFPGSTVSDKTMIDCAGNPTTAIAVDRDDRMVSILHVGTGTDGEPALMCSFSATGAAPFTTSPLVRGVENFQVLYGTDGAVANTAPPTNAASAAAISDIVPDRFLRADQMTVTSDAVGTNANWRRVRSLRIGMVIRGPVNSVQERTTQTFYPLGPGKGSSGGTVGSSLSSANDPNTEFTPSLDGRLRQVVTFTVHLRNDQGF